MKQKLLLTLIIAATIFSAGAQKSTTAYAITGAQKGSSAWQEVRLVDLTTGEELKTIYQNSQEPQILNARTGNAVVKKDIANEIAQRDNGNNYQVIKKDPAGSYTVIIRQRDFRFSEQKDKPFATRSAAMAYDKKHDRLYYTPMGINQLRFIDLKSKTSKIFYFEDDAFGEVRNSGDVNNQITRMVIGADGNGYALSNDGNHFIRFTTNKKGEITDLGALSDDGANARNSVHSQNNYGGDMVASKSGDLYLIGANHAIFKINIDSKVATYKGSIQGLPQGFSTNGAAVEEGTKIIVASSNSTVGYYRFDLNTLSAEKIENSGSVYGASDLANGNLISEKKTKKDKEPEQPEVKAETPIQQIAKPERIETVEQQNKVSVYPNPVTNGVAKISFQDLPQGRYQVQLIELSGKTLSSQSVIVTYKTQTENLTLPKFLAKGTYQVNIVDESNKIVNSTKLIVQ